MNDFSDFCRRISRQFPCYFEPGDMLSPRLMSLFQSLKSEGILVHGGYIECVDMPGGEREAVLYLPVSLASPDRYAYCIPTSSGGGKFYLSLDEVRRWCLHFESFLAWLGKKWGLSGSPEAMQAENIWLMGTLKGVQVLFVRDPNSALDANPRLFDGKMVIGLSSGSGIHTLQTFVSSQESGDIMITPILDAVYAVRGYGGEDSASILLDEEADCRFSFDRRFITYIKPGDLQSTTVKLEKRDCILLKFLYNQSISNSQRKYFDNDFIRLKCPDLKTQKTLDNAKSTLSCLHEKNVGLPPLVIDNERGSLRLHDGLSCMRPRRKGYSQKTSQK